MEVKIKIIDGGKMPEFKTQGAVCADAYARLEEDLWIGNGDRRLVPLGFALELPVGYEAVVRPRSGNSKNGVDIAIGSIDYDYRGEVCAIVINNTCNALVIENGMRICQIAVREVPLVTFKQVDRLSETKRAGNGFGSTGIN